jgi:hypothetical protein
MQFKRQLWMSFQSADLFLILLLLCLRWTLISKYTFNWHCGDTTVQHQLEESVHRRQFECGDVWVERYIGCWTRYRRHQWSMKITWKLCVWTAMIGGGEAWHRVRRRTVKLIGRKKSLELLCEDIVTLVCQSRLRWQTNVWCHWCISHLISCEFWLLISVLMAIISWN